MEYNATELLVEKSAISELIYKYCYFFDRNEPEKLVELFTRDAEVDYGPEVPALIGKVQILEMVSKGLRETFIATSHHVSNVIVTISSLEIASSTSYVYAWHQYRNKSEIGHLWGGYNHEFRKVDGVWRIHRLRLYGVGIENFHRTKMHSNGRN